MQAMYDLTIDEWEKYFLNHNEKKYKAKYLYNFLYKEKSWQIKNIILYYL